MAAELLLRPITSERSVEEVVRGFLARDLGRILLADPAARAGHDDEGVHQVRVNVRHLRSELRTMAPVLRAKELRVIDREARWLAGSLAPRRDLDVLAGLFSSMRGRSVPVPAGLEASLNVERRRAGDGVSAALESERYRALLDRLMAAALDPPVRSSARGADAGETLRPGLLRAADELLGAVDQAGPSPDASTLHQIRILAKRLRYSCQLGSGLLLGAEEAAGELEKVQGSLGDLHDLVVARSYLERWSEGRPPGPDAGVEATRRALAQATGRARVRWRAPVERARRALAPLRS